MSRKTAAVGGRIYAEALAAAAKGKGLLDQVGDELKALIERREGEGSLVRAFFGSSAIRREQKMAKIEAAFRGRASDLFTDFLLLLVMRNRLELVEDIGRAYHAILDHRGSRVRVTLTTAAPMADADLEAIKTRLRPVLGDREPVLRHKIDAGLIGGMVLRTGDWMADGSVRRVLKELRRRLTGPARAALPG